jgi:acetyl-CoA carboxylase biotin carboxyl carrier protein
MGPSSKTNVADSNTKIVRELADILDQAGLTELEYETETLAIRLSRTSRKPQEVEARQSTSPALAAASATPPPANPADSAGAITSPMVGTVYTAAEPGSATFVSEGDGVKVGQTLFIIEAMKVMNPITAATAGKVTKIFVQNAQPIEYGEALAILE